MNSAAGKWLAALALLLGLLPTFSAPANSALDSSAILTWRKDKSADARIENLPLPKVLSRLSAATGWRIFLQPGLDQNVSVNFQNASQGDALKLLLGNFSYALVPQAGANAKLFVYKTSVSEATTLIEPERATRPKNWLEKEMIVSLAPGSKQDVEKLAEELGGKVVGKTEALNAYRFEFADAETAEAARRKIADREDLAYQDNFSYQRPDITSGGGTPSPQSMFPIDPKPVPRGEQIVVALVDTPIQPLDAKLQGFILPGVHIRGEPGPLPADPTHATSMALDFFNSYAFAKSSGAAQTTDAFGRVRVLPIDIYGSSSSTTTFEMAQGIYEAIKANVNWINLPHGGQGGSPMVDYLLEQANGKGIMVSAAAGNEPTTAPTYPAANPYTIAVTAVDARGNIAPYANRGSFVDVKAPGTIKVNYNNQSYYSTGTSTATSFVTGQAAAFMAMGYTSAEAANMIRAKYDVNAAIQAQPRR